MVSPLKDKYWWLKGLPRQGRFDKKVRKLGYCCPMGYLKLRAPKATMAKMIEETDCSERTIFLKRQQVGEGKEICMRRNECLRAMWQSPSDMKKMDKSLTPEEKRKLRSDPLSEWFGDFSED